MNTNIRTLKRVQRMHANFAALNLNAEEGGMGDEPPDIGEEGMVDEVIDERPWRVRYAGLRQVKGPVELEVGEKNVDECLKWMNWKVLDHEGFQGSFHILLCSSSWTSSAALDALVWYAKSMMLEEIILHTLFESGVTRIQDLEQYIKDDVVWHDLRLVDLEEKFVGAYCETVKTQVEILNDDALFACEDDKDDESAFVMGGFSDSLGDGFLGLREPGIAAELGLSSLTIPKKLLKGKPRGAAGATIEAKPKEPLPPYPPLPPLLPIMSKNVGDQIGLLCPSLGPADRFSNQCCALVTSDIAFHAISIFSH
ncbi:uncharacterized protein HD556DRAFT_1479090 [Suillus plorans]|uniref:Uncharacterized protein n=1 Tax=Suillus plorans TaxID=116603 RepID=A0A9P7AQF7_9AGAM|nr:uncharacterized protein HD556DRAFT_1479090 [Suillus plorans]KAG1793465.1 hypothetical protein HD556DRAFT_1479090 [Suillus plorans]